MSPFQSLSPDLCVGVALSAWAHSLWPAMAVSPWHFQTSAAGFAAALSPEGSCREGEARRNPFEPQTQRAQATLNGRAQDPTDSRLMACRRKAIVGLKRYLVAHSAHIAHHAEDWGVRAAALCDRQLIFLLLAYLWGCGLAHAS
ncbi:hypothetical protein K431DRAFT_113294 [Polychaeton citri CBS 116435]|uniref:Uncharacterized protein n=1 Tax=Polychaeton citri CBS 116435 TaxID=1314669 RepID=A0A9P4Q2J4_9PEZI|nr:hypothetical protein K431DRAFT_113294 [Polychaeton citri CBS 116435]